MPGGSGSGFTAHFVTMQTSGKPRIDHIAPPAALPGGDITIHGSGFATRNHHVPQVRFGEARAEVL